MSASKPFMYAPVGTVLMIVLVFSVSCGPRNAQQPAAEPSTAATQTATKESPESDDKRYEVHPSRQGSAFGVYPVSCDDTHIWKTEHTTGPPDSFYEKKDLPLGKPPMRPGIVLLESSNATMDLPFLCILGDEKNPEGCDPAAVPHDVADEFFKVDDQCFRQTIYTDRLNMVLIMLGEPSIATLPQSDIETYRVTFDDAFFPPTAIRLEKNQRGVFVLYKELKRNKKFVLPDGVLLQLSTEHFAFFSNLLDKSGFWEMPVRSSRLGLDGEVVTVEGWKDGKYHVVQRWNPSRGYIRRAYEYLEAISEISREP